MGVVPLCFKAGEDAETLGLTGHERYTVDLPDKISEIRPGQDVTVRTDTGKPLHMHSTLRHRAVHTVCRFWSRVLHWLGYNRAVGNWCQEIEWVEKMARSRKSRAEITSCAFAKVIYSIWNDRNMARFQQSEPDGSRTCKELAIHVYIKGETANEMED